MVQDSIEVLQLLLESRMTKSRLMANLEARLHSWDWRHKFILRIGGKTPSLALESHLQTRLIATVDSEVMI